MKGKTNTLKSSGWILVAILISAAMLAGCSSATPTLEPTLDQLPTFSAIQTQAVETVVAGMTADAPTATEVPTEAPVIPTETPMPPTETPEPVVILPTETATRIPATLAPTITFTPTQAAYNCSIAEQSPASGAKFAKNADFDARWKIKNTGTSSWQKTGVDIKYISGTKFQKYGDIFDLTESVNPDGHITFVIDMVAPDSTGKHTAVWALVDGSITICTLNLSITVE
jgi:hypothetical protein